MAVSLKRRVFDLLEAGDRRTLPARLVDNGLCLLIVVSVVAIALESVATFGVAYGGIFQTIEILSLTVFTLEYVARLWVCTEHAPFSHQSPAAVRLNFARTPTMIIDLLAIAPALLLPFVGPELLMLRLFRLIRLLKLARFSPALTTLGRVLYLERRALVAAIMIMLALIMFAASGMHLIERHIQPDEFGSIPAAMWWAMATLTTVGYGDVTPVTPLGRLFAGLISVLGIGMYALPIAIIASGFTNEVHRREFVVTWGMVARVPLFAKLDARAIAKIAGLLHSQEVPAGYTVQRRGENADCMYFIASGEVEVKVPRGSVTLEAGDFFGEISLVYRTTREATVVAKTDCRLMVLEADDFHRLMDESAHIKVEVTRVAAERRAAATGDVLPEELGEGPAAAPTDR